jgi:hypothetical protein
MEGKGIEIPVEILEDLKRVKKQNEDEQTGPIGGIIDDETENAETVKNLDHFMKLVKWGAETFDTTMKTNGMPGLNKVSPDEFAEATKIWIEYEGFESIAEQSPRLLMAGLLISIGSSNAVAFRRLQKQNKKQKTEGAE